MKKRLNPFVETRRANEIFILDQQGYKLATNQQDLTPLQRRFLILMQQKQNREQPKSNDSPNNLKKQLKQKVKQRREG
ncbi:hypothetical protein [Sporohalobacter salinus]|uniref:hypothetical protein n=1 Tax=Sporohalobacter salinus TaxID=1494606 RepID=UPI001961ED83|nr:hypothetical protein [Sporohalobacter salinus]MBM7623717.1 putative membrane-anchored protein [Sporohalobacter salinus]